MKLSQILFSFLLLATEAQGNVCCHDYDMPSATCDDMCTVDSTGMCPIGTEGYCTTNAGYCAMYYIGGTLDANGDCVDGNGNVIYYGANYEAACTQFSAHLWCEQCGAACGDPHIKTWSGRWFDFHGECDLLLVSEPEFKSGLGIDIHIRTKIRRGYSFIESAAIKIGHSIFEVSSWGEYTFNGVEGADMDAVVLGDKYPVAHTKKEEKENTFMIQLDGDEQIVVSNLKDMVNVRMVNANYTTWYNARGLMGDIHGRMIGRDGETIIEDPNEFGFEWQVLESEAKLFRVNREPQHPAKCVMPKVQAETQRRLGNTIAREAAETACSHWKEENFDHCVFDVLATGDMELAQAGAY